MPFAGYPNFQACLVDLQSQGHDAESARRICGSIQAAAERSIRITLNTDAGLPNEFKIFNAGDNVASKEPSVVTYDPKKKESLIAEYQASDGRDLVGIDVDHMTFDVGPPESHASMGWFRLSFEDDGVWARDVQWTDQGARLLEQRAFRYLSPAFNVDEDGHLARIINVALTNVPATVSPQPLVNSHREESSGACYLETKMSDVNTRAQAAELAEDAPMSPEEMMAAIDALKAENEALKAKLADAEAAMSDAVTAKENIEKENILNSLAKEGLLQPAVRRSLSKLTLVDVKSAEKDIRGTATPHKRVDEAPATNRTFTGTLTNVRGN